MTLKIGSHVGMSGKDMFVGSVKEALSYGANTFMVYTGAPQNTRRKALEELKIDEAKKLMTDNGIEEFVVHAPYIINLANTVKPETFELAVSFLRTELVRSAAMGSSVLILHPGSHVDAGTDAGIRKICEGLNEALEDAPDCFIALETMAGKGSEVGRTFEELAAIYDGVKKNDRLRVCMDTCHLNDAGYDVVHDFDGILTRFDRLIGLNQIAAVHINDSKNPSGAHKDRHANLGQGEIGFEALRYVVYHPALEHAPKILETPWVPSPANPKETVPPYKEEIALLRQAGAPSYS